jgi:N-acetyl-anhydromuramyl-L-alanine amidase AmpD
LKFIQARNYTRVTSPARNIDLVVIHTAEYPELPESAEWVANYFAKPGAPKASAHYMVDASEVIQGVWDKDVAWAAPGANHNGIQIEHAGYAKQTKKDWSDDYSKRMLARSAKLTARLCRKHNIPVRWVSPSQLRAGRRGLTSHANVSAAFKRSSHWDPGPNYTGNLTGYYGWRRTNAPAKVLIEHGFLTNPNERAFLFSHLAEIALAEYRATLAYFGYLVTPKPREPVIVNMPLEETIAMLKKTPAYKRGWRRMVELVQRYESMRKK